MKEEDNNHSLVKEPIKEPVKSISLLAVGDVSLGARVDESLSRSEIFDLVKDEISSSNISVGNLECVLGEKGTQIRTYNNLRAKSSWAKQLRLFTLLNLANNHILDFGKEGMDETINLLQQEGILTSGAGDDYSQALHPVILQVDSLKIGFFGFMYDEGVIFQDLARARAFQRAGPARYFEQDVLSLIHELKSNVDFIVVSIHWGLENVGFPSPQQRILARKLVSNGVDLVLGHHPHEVQGVERILKGLVFYSLGNFVFDPELSQARYGLMARIEIGKNGIANYTAFTVGINDRFQPKKLNDKFITEEFQRKSRLLELLSDKPYKNWWFEHTSQTFVRSLHSNINLIKKFGLKYLPSFLVSLMLPFSVEAYAGLIRTKIRKFI